MSSYYANGDLASWEAQKANHQHQLELHAEQVAHTDAYNEQAHAAWESAHDAWAADPGDPPAPEPLEPEPEQAPPPPSTPEPQLTTYTARLVEEAEELETPSGTALVLPGRTVLTGGGQSFAVGDTDLEYGYVDAATVTL